MEKAVLNVSELYITQGMNGTYSHNGDLAIDISKLTYFKAPFTGVIKRIYKNCNAVWLESSDKVEYADGTKDYMTIMTLHDNDISNLSVGQIIKQGEIYYHPGTKGISTGTHIHIAVGKGKFKGNGWYKGKYQSKVKSYAWLIYNQYDITKALYIDKSVKQSNPVYKWKILSNILSNSNTMQKYAIGESVIINGNLYLSSNDSNPNGNVKNKITKITRYSENSKHPYNTSGDLGWMDESSIKSLESTYIVKKGDTLYSIAKKYNMTWKEIYEKNKKIIGDNPNIIKAGQIFVIN